MLFMLAIRRNTMIDKNYWKKIADEWKTEDDGIEPIPPISPIQPLPPDEDEGIDDEISDILADLDLD